MSGKTIAIGLAVLSLSIAGGTAIESTFAVAADSPAAGGVPCSGVWKMNEELTRRTRSPIGPFYQFFEPWGKDGWMRMNTGELDRPLNGGEWHFEQFNNKPYQVFGGDPSLQHSRKITGRIIETTRVRDRKEADYSLVVFSKDCKRVTYYFPEGDDRHGAPGKEHYYNDIRVFDAIEPPSTTIAPAASDVFGGWMMNRQMSKLTLAPKDAETVVIVPWGNSGWIWSQLSGSPYQPEDLVRKVQRVECGAASGPAAIACKGPPPHLNLYWATWDAKTYATYGSNPRQVQAARINDRTFEATFFKAPENAGRGDKSTVVFSPDGQHLTVTTKDDVRVYDRINAGNWPTVAP